MQMDKEEDTGGYRVDKWLCAARFFKTRSLASDAVECGHVLVNQARVKPARALAPGDMLDISIGQKKYTVEVQGFSNRRGPASEAQKLYRETEESRLRRATVAAQFGLDPQRFRFSGRPTKRDRREIERLIKARL